MTTHPSVDHGRDASVLHERRELEEVLPRDLPDKLFDRASVEYEPRREARDGQEDVLAAVQDDDSLWLNGVAEFAQLG